MKALPSGRTPPNDLDAERSVIGACLESRDALAEVAGTLRSEDFYQPAHREIWRECLELFTAGEPVDAITLKNRLQARNAPDGRGTLLEMVGGLPYLHELLEAYPVASSAPRYASIVSKLAARRRVIDAGHQIVAAGYELDADEAYQRAEAAMVEARRHRTRAELRPLRGMLNDYMGLIDEHGERELLGLSTGFPKLDAMTAGMQSGQLWVVAARPSMGKSAFLGDLALAGAQQDAPVLWFSLEMTEDEIVGRLLSAIGELHGQVLRRGGLSDAGWSRLSRALGVAAKLPIEISDAMEVTPLDMRAAARRRRLRPGLVLVDYLQLLSLPGKHESRTIEVGEITRDLKRLAKELDTPVVVASQLNRGVEHRADKKPHLGDLRESGSIEQDADVVLMLYRAEVYDDDPKHAGKAEIIVAKNRNGPTGSLFGSYRAEFTTFRPRRGEVEAEQPTMLDTGVAPV